MRIKTSVLIAALAAVAAAGAFSACFSERGVTGPVADCNLPVQGDVIGSTVVVIKDFAFEPAEIRVARGTRVTWINCGPDAAHTSTSSANPRVWDSPLLAPGQTYSRTFNETGTFAYFCVPHPFMTARVIVQ